MEGFTPSEVRVIACDVFGTTVDWRTGVAEQLAAIAGSRGVELDAGEFADQWRDRYLPSMRRVNDGERRWAYLDTLHRESLDELLAEHGLDARFDDADRQAMVRTWHRLPAWPDSVTGLARLRRHRPVVAFSNGGFALLAHLINHARLPFDAALSAELARAYKPAAAAYRTAVELLDLEPHQVLMVAAHVWDTRAAAAAGLRTAFLHRPREKGPHRQADASADADTDLTVGDFHELADELDGAVPGSQ